MKNFVSMILLLVLSTSTLFTSHQLSLSELLQKTNFGDPFDIKKLDHMFYDIQSHIDFNKDVLSAEEVMNLHYQLWKIMILKETKSANMDLFAKYSEIIDEAPDFEHDMQKLHEAQFGKIHNKRNDNLPAFAQDSECFSAAEYPYPTQFNGDTVRGKIMTDQLYAAKPLYDLYFTCIEKVKENKNKIIKEYEQKISKQA